MSVFYLDTSVLVAALGNEQHTTAIQDWLSDRQAGELNISDWVITEFSSALALKLRSGQWQAEHRSECLATFARLVEQSLTVVPVSSANFRSAARLADQHQSGLRAGDALHLAVCAEHGMRLVTLDNTMAAAARTNAIPTQTAKILRK